MAKKKKTCAVCGANLTGKNAPMVFDETERKVKKRMRGQLLSQVDDEELEG